MSLPEKSPSSLLPSYHLLLLLSALVSTFGSVPLSEAASVVAAHRQICSRIARHESFLVGIGMLSTRLLLLTKAGNLVQLPPASLNALARLDFTDGNVCHLDDLPPLSRLVTISQTGRDFLLGEGAQGHVLIIDADSHNVANGTLQRPEASLTPGIAIVWLSSSVESTFYSMALQQDGSLLIRKMFLKSTQTITEIIQTPPSQWLCKVNASHALLNNTSCKASALEPLEIWPVKSGFFDGQRRMYLFTGQSIYIFTGGKQIFQYMTVPYEHFFDCQGLKTKASLGESGDQNSLQELKMKKRGRPSETEVIIVIVAIIVFVLVTLMALYFCFKAPERPSSQSSLVSEEKRRGLVAGARRRLSGASTALKNSSLKKSRRQHRASGGGGGGSVVGLPQAHKSVIIPADHRYGKLVSSRLILTEDLAQPSKSDLSLRGYELLNRLKATGRSIYEKLKNGGNPIGLKTAPTKEKKPTGLVKGLSRTVAVHHRSSHQKGSRTHQQQQKASRRAGQEPHSPHQTHHQHARKATGDKAANGVTGRK